MRPLLITLLVFNFSLLCYSQDTTCVFVKLIHGKDTIYFDDISNKYICSKINSDSTKEIFEVYETRLLKDTILIRPKSYTYSSIKDKSSKNSTIYYSANTSERIKIPINKIYYVKKSRNRLKFLAGLTCLGSMISVALTTPLNNLEFPFKTKTYYSIADPSAVIFVSSLTVGILWGNKYYYTQKHRKRKTWKIE